MLEIKENKIKIIILLCTIIFLVILYFFYNCIIINSSIYKEKLHNLTNIIIEGNTAPRGRIYDRNGILLVDNKKLPTLVFKDNNKIDKNSKIQMCYDLTNIIELEYSKVSKRSLKEFYYELNSENVSKKITEEEWNKYKMRVLTDNDIYNLKISRITDDEINNLNEDDKKAAYIYYLINNGYNYENKIIKKDLTDIEYSYIQENIDNYSGLSIDITWEREYIYKDTLRSILGSVGKITKETKDYYLNEGYSLNDVVGLSYLEKQYDNILKGKKSKYKKINSKTLEKISDEEKGNDIVITIDIELQQKVDEIVKEELLKAKKEANTEFLNKNYVIIQEPNTGEILAISGIQLLNINNENKFFDISSGTIMDSFTPGSVVKGASILVGYNTGVLKINEYIKDECLKIKSSPLKCSSHYIGTVNDIEALAQSSNVYQFKIAIRVGNGTYSYNSPLSLNMDAFDIYRSTFKEFGLGTLTEIDLPGEKIGYMGKKRDTNLLLNYSIGQYDNYTPIELSQYITTIASNGNRIKPHILKEIHYTDNNVSTIEPIILNTLNTKVEYLERVKQGFIAVLDHGTGAGVINKKYKPAGKTGTSESFIDTNNDGVIDTNTISQALVTYMPYDNPKITLTVITPDVQNPNNKNNHFSFINRKIAREITNYYFSR